MYVVPDRLELLFPQISQGYFSLKGHDSRRMLNILCNWICHQLIAGERSWPSIKEELRLEDDNALEGYFQKVTGLSPLEFAEYRKREEGYSNRYRTFSIDKI